MKNFLILVGLFQGCLVFGQDKKDTIIQKVQTDTTRLKLGKKDVIIISENGRVKKAEYNPEDEEMDADTLDAAPQSKEDEDYIEAHWAGLDLGFASMLNQAGSTSFPTHPYWQNDPAKSIYFNLNLVEHKFSIYKNYVGITTGLGFGFTQFAFNNNYIIHSNADSTYAMMDTLSTYSKNKLKASYLQVPLMLEFCTSDNDDKNFYLLAGVVGGVRMTSKVKREGTTNDKDFEVKNKGTYGLNPFKLDATVRMGYNDWGAFVTYGLIPVFDTQKTEAVHPLTFGLSYNF